MKNNLEKEVEKIFNKYKFGSDLYAVMDDIENTVNSFERFVEHFDDGVLFPMNMKYPKEYKNFKKYLRLYIKEMIKDLDILEEFADQQEKIKNDLSQYQQYIALKKKYENKV